MISAVKFLLPLLFIFSFVSSRFLKENELPLQVQGRYVTDSQGKRVKLACVNWHGAHMNTFVPSGLYFKTPKEVAKLIRKYGFNCVRLNWSVELVFKNPHVRPEAIRSILRGAKVNWFSQRLFGWYRALDVMDLVVEALASEQVMVVLDNHMLDAGWCCDPRDANGLWFNDRWSANDYEEAWERMVLRYKDQPYVIAADLHNEVRPDIRIEKKWWMLYPKVSVRMPVWGRGTGVVPLKDFDPSFLSYTHPKLENVKYKVILFLLRKIFGGVNIEYYDWHEQSTKTANKILQKNPNLLIMSQGVFDLSSYIPTAVHLIFNALKNDPSLWNLIGKHLDIPDEVTGYAQLHNLTGIMHKPLNLSIPDKVVYSSHFYPFFYNSSHYKWDNVTPTYEEFSNVTDKYWGNIFKQQNIPVWVGEFGTDTRDFGLSDCWNNYVLRYMRENDLDLCYWPLFDARPHINALGEYIYGEDEYGLARAQTGDVVNPKHYDSFKDMLIQEGIQEDQPAFVIQN